MIPSVTAISGPCRSRIKLFWRKSNLTLCDLFPLTLKNRECYKKTYPSPLWLLKHPSFLMTNYDKTSVLRDRIPVCALIMLGGLCLLAHGKASGQAAQSPQTVAPSNSLPSPVMDPSGKWLLHDEKRPQPKVVIPGTAFSVGASAPSDAEVLFDGHGLSKWEGVKGGDAVWPVREDYMETLPKGGGIRTRGKWADFQLHVEWASPKPPEGTGQGRGNSGILINNMYEIQVLDSYESTTYPDGQAAAVYGQSPPLVNACKPPGEWQSYDILFESPRWNDKGELVKKAAVTVLHNGLVVQNHYELVGCTDGINPAVPWRSASKYPEPHPPEVFVQLQDHKNPVRFRNIWIRPMHLGDA